LESILPTFNKASWFRAANL